MDLYSSSTRVFTPIRLSIDDFEIIFAIEINTITRMILSPIRQQQNIQVYPFFHQ